jgi:hypothetical protein
MWELLIGYVEQQLEPFPYYGEEHKQRNKSHPTSGNLKPPSNRLR